MAEAHMGETSTFWEDVLEMVEHKQNDLIFAFITIVVAVILMVIGIDIAVTLGTPSLRIQTKDAEKKDVITAASFDPTAHRDKDVVPCYDPSTMQLLGYVPAMSAQDVADIIQRGKAAALKWKESSFSKRRQLLRIMLKFIIENQETICRVSARDSGKTMVDAILGEIVVTCEKLHWLMGEGEQWLTPERRSAGRMSFYKAPRVEYHPVGVVGAIVPWNYPFHNLLNPISAAIFSGNAIIIKVSEHASWSTSYYSRFLQAALKAGGAPPELVQFVTGYGEAGNALVTGGVDKLIFVGSTAIGKKVMAAAAESLTPVVLELGGKDPVIVCEDANLDEVVQVACKAAFLNCGQNCAGGERFFIHEKVYDAYCSKVVAVVNQMRQGSPLGGGTVDCGALCMAGHAQKLQALVDDAVAHGATVLAGGKIPTDKPGQFYPPTVLAGIKKGMKIWEEEVFGPVMSIISWSTDDEVVAMANDCDFGLASCAFSKSQSRARALCARLEAGMTSINDFGTTYMCQSLPFGGVKHSGFNNFAGVEGLRGLCVAKAVSEDRVPWLMKSSLPPVWQYPVKDIGFKFGTYLVTMFYGPGILYRIEGLFKLAGLFLLPGKPSAKKSN